MPGLNGLWLNPGLGPDHPILGVRFGGLRTLYAVDYTPWLDVGRTAEAQPHGETTGTHPPRGGYGAAPLSTRDGRLLRKFP